jgi:hypothetical protein
MRYRYITNKFDSIRLPYQYDGDELLSWLQEQYPNSQYRVVEIA